MNLNQLPQPQTNPQIKEQAVRSIIWSVLSQILPRLVTPITTLILAALLTPDDFGLVAAATLVISMAQIVVGMGFGATVIQRKTEVEDTASMAFWMSLTLAVAAYGMLWLIGPSLAAFYKMAPLSNILRITGISLIIYAFTSTPSALLTKNLKFKRLFIINAIPQVINGIVSVVLAYLKFGYWALIIGSITSLVCTAILAWIFSKWKPAFVWRPEIAKSIFVFSSWILLANIQSWFYLSADNALAGYFFGPKGLGQYSLGFNLGMLVAGMIVTPIAAVVYPTLCKMSTKKEIGIELAKIQSLTSAFLFPACLGLSAIAPQVVALLYGNKWPELGMIIQVLAIMPGIANLWSLNADAFRAAGQPGAYTRISLIGLFLLLPVLFLAGHFGLQTFVIARFLSALLTPILCIFVAAKILSIPIREQFRGQKIPLIGSLVLFVFVLASIRFLAPYQGAFGFIKIIFCSFLGGVLYLGILRLFDKLLFLKLVMIVRSTIFSMKS